ncbi:MAG: hypothetical protein ACYSUK_00095 [Planctomycetota bacterium]|jgi:hypothetical protein
MKLGDGILECPDTGECDIDIDHIAKCFGKSFISYWHDTYRLHNKRAKVKVTLTEIHADELINKLSLTKYPSPIFKNAGIFK